MIKAALIIIGAIVAALLFYAWAIREMYDG